MQARYIHTAVTAVTVLHRVGLSCLVKKPLLVASCLLLGVIILDQKDPRLAIPDIHYTTAGVNNLVQNGNDHGQLIHQSMYMYITLPSLPLEFLFTSPSYYLYPPSPSQQHLLLPSISRQTWLAPPNPWGVATSGWTDMCLLHPWVMVCHLPARLPSYLDLSEPGRVTIPHRTNRTIQWAGSTSEYTTTPAT